MSDISQSIETKQQEKPVLIRVGITQGDTNGVGLELILKTFAENDMYDTCIPVVYGHAKVMSYHRKALNLNTPFKIVRNAGDIQAGQLNFVNCSDEEVKVEFGKLSAEAGNAAFIALEQAVLDLKEGKIDVLVTAPINKAGIQNANFHFAGHTEYLHDRVGAPGNEPLMILCNDMMRVALVTTHLPISEIAFSITQEKIEQKVRAFYDSLIRDFNVSAPRIAVLALNPHAGDNGVLGHEEKDVIMPAIKALSDTGMACYGPFAADGFFGAGLYHHFDGVLAMYHDQGLAPFKALSMDNGINFTAGISYIRTSPDHGTAYDIAGKNMANVDSFRRAIFSAIDLYRNRRRFDAAHANPLPKIYQDRKEN